MVILAFCYLYYRYADNKVHILFPVVAFTLAIMTKRENISLICLPLLCSLYRNKEIKNKTIRSFLYYVPYVTLTVMTFPAILEATGSVWSGLAALVIGVLIAWKGGSLLIVSVVSCVVVFLLEMFII